MVALGWRVESAHNAGCADYSRHINVLADRFYTVLAVSASGKMKGARNSYTHVKKDCWLNKPRTSR